MIKRCEHCHRVGGRSGSNRVCAECKSRGWRWCSMGRHTVQAAQHIARRVACYDCRREETRQQKLRSRGVAVAPPAGYVRLTEAIAQLGYSRSHLTALIRAGRMEGWQRTRRGMWYVRRPE